MHKHRILVMGAGKIGVTVAALLNHSGDYMAYVSDINPPHELPKIKNNPIEFVTGNIKEPEKIKKFITENKIEAIVSCLPFNLTIEVAKIAHACGIHYFDPTEDVATTAAVTELAKTSKATFAPQCGLAPGFISIAANSLMQGLNDINIVKMRVGALTQSTSNFLKYAFTWSIDGLVNEYIHPCIVLEDGIKKSIPALGGMESITIDGDVYEAFYTSGGVGSMTDTYLGKVKYLDYKTIRYPGHCEKMAFLLQDLKLRERPELLKEILSHVIPHVEDDKVVIYVSVQGYIKGRLTEKTYTNTLYPTNYDGNVFTAIQMTTAAGICTIIDLVVKEKKLSGIVKQEQVSLDEFISNRFGSYYKKGLN
jgi:saccharopine dehydrogenase (NAD+, L-lysine-forming)